MSEMAFIEMIVKARIRWLECKILEMGMRGGGVFRDPFYPGVMFHIVPDLRNRIYYG